MHDFTPIPALIGGALIGLAASIFLLTHGRVAGISGLYGGVFRKNVEERSTRIAFILGLVVAGLCASLLFPRAFATTWTASLPMVVAAGLLVGFGTQLGGGCTSGHGVCGMSRLSTRSVVATGIFMLTAGVTVFVVRHVLGLGQP